MSGRRRTVTGQLSFDIRSCRFCDGAFVPGKRPTQRYCSRLCQKRDKKFKPDLIERIQQERRKGRSFKAIAQDLKLSVGAVHCYAKNE